MKAWTYSEYGGIEVLHLDPDVPVPEPNDDEVLVKVAAVGLNPIDFKRRLGFFEANCVPFPVSAIVSYYIFLINYTCIVLSRPVE